MQSFRVVMRDKFLHNSPGVLQVYRAIGANTFLLNCLVPSFYFPVTLRIERRRFYMRHSTYPNILLEILCYELWAIVRNDPWFDLRIFLFSPFQDNFHLRFLHYFPNFPMDYLPAITV